MIPPSSDGTCPFKRSADTDCQGRFVKGPVVCQWSGESGDRDRRHSCNRFYREAALKPITPGAFCCRPFEDLFHDCAEEGGFHVGCFDLVIYPNDGKDVWRNRSRQQFRFCPFCGTALTGIYAIKETGR